MRPRIEGVPSVASSTSSPAQVHRRVRLGVFLGTSVAVALAVVVLAKYRGTAASEPGYLVLGFVYITALLVTGGLMAVGLRTRTVEDDHTVRIGVAVGVVTGAVWVTEESYNMIFTAAIPTRDLVDDLLLALIALILFIFGLGRAFRTRQVGQGVRTGLWSGAVGGMIACLTAEVFIVFFMNLITQDPASVHEWADQGPGSGAPTIETYWAYASLKGALLLHLVLVGPVMGGLVGALGGAIGTGLSALRRSPA
jgi:hypothetical protein